MGNTQIGIMKIRLLPLLRASVGCRFVMVAFPSNMRVGRLFSCFSANPAPSNGYYDESGEYWPDPNLEPRLPEGGCALILITLAIIILVAFLIAIF